MTEPVGVVGAGTMGAGIAQVAAVAGRRVLVADAVPGRSVLIHCGRHVVHDRAIDLCPGVPVCRRHDLR